MNSRERVIRTITFQNPDRIPTDLWIVPAAFLTHDSKIEGLLEKYPIDFDRPGWITRWDPAKVDPTFRLGSYTDEWGVVWHNVDEGWQGQVAAHPLDDWSKLSTFKAPAPTVPADYVRHPNKFCFTTGGHFFHRMCFLRNMENVMMDIYDDSPEIYKLREIVWDYFRRTVEMSCRMDVDGIFFYDDFGSQTQLLVSPAIWRAFIRPVYEDLISICKQAGKYVFLHSDGYILEVIEDLIEIGVDALNCQVWCMGPELLGEKFRGRITFWGEISRQETLPHGAPDDVRASAAKMKECLATPAGGLIGQSEIDGITPLENIEALLTAWDYRRR
ncbi:MAG: hypothetical protein HYX78_12810 [Armatimonadetes bacterium]|nr:hypothetical protein [Armatimonadota bacterium]